ncbi:hypothetical protein MRQ36_02265 [Micromonospora sp. R77]|nr:hypothetical protein [Micromonospora sp. R77]MCI4061462.1 hypothetical protein [Micromonospora sp. R77]
MAVRMSRAQATGEALVGKDVPNRGGQVRAEQGGRGAIAVLPRRSEHRHGDQQAGDVGDDEPLPAVDLLAGVVAAAVRADGAGALDRLRVDDPGRRLRLATLLNAGFDLQCGREFSVTPASPTG